MPSSGERDAQEGHWTICVHLWVMYVSSRLLPPNFQHLQLAVPLVYKSLFCAGCHYLCTLYSCTHETQLNSDDPTPNLCIHLSPPHLASEHNMNVHET
jgi:hypothetical protein